MLDIIVKYWVEWLCGLVALAVTFGAKHYIKLQKQSIEKQREEHDEALKEESIKTLEKEIQEEVNKSDRADAQVKADIEVMQSQLENLSTGLLSIQGKQFRENCLYLLDTEHTITFPEYEQFEEDYVAYKALGGNHRGDALHDRVVEKFNAQITK